MVQGVRILHRTINGRKHWVARIPDPRDGGRYREVRVYARAGVPRSKQTRGGAEKLAEDLLCQWEIEVEEAREEEAARIRQQGELTVAQLVELAIAEPGVPKVRDELSPDTIAARKRTLVRFRDWLTDSDGDVRAVDVKPQHVERFLNQRQEADGVGAETVKRDASVIKRAWTYAIETELVPHGTANPVRRRQRRASLDERQQKARARAFTDAEAERILTALRDGYTIEVEAEATDGSEETVDVPIEYKPPRYLYNYCYLAAETGLRPGALRQLRWDDVDLDAEVIRIRREANKGGAQTLLLTPAALLFLRELRATRCSVLVLPDDDGKPVARDRLARIFTRHMDRLGIPGKGITGFRHRFGLRAIERFGVPINRVRQLMGHASVTTTQIYMNSDLVEYQDEYRSRVSGEEDTT